MSLPLPPGQTPRAWQVEAEEAARFALRPVPESAGGPPGLGHQAVIVSAATGTGKGSLIAGLAIMAARRGNRVLALAHREEILDDLVARIRRVPGAPDVGLVRGQHNQMLNPIVVASVQSLRPKRLKQLGKVGLVLTDECHHSLAATYLRVYDSVAEENPRWKHIGFTATPFRTGKKAGTTLGLGKVFQAVAYEYGIGDAIDAGDLVPPRGVRVATDVSLDGVKIATGGDFDEAELAARLDVPARNDLVAQEYTLRCKGQPALVFCTSIEHSKHMAEAFVRAGVKAAAVWGDMPIHERRDLIGRYRDRAGIDVLCSRDLIFEGFDAPATAAIFQARPTQSRVIFTQMIGRGLRLYPGKTECLVVSFADRGTGLDLATISDLSNDDPQDAPGAKPVCVGDEVIRRRLVGWGVGIVRRVDFDEDVEIYYVAWPVTQANPSGGIRPHTRGDIARAPVEAEEGQLVTVSPTIAGVKTYEMLLLPGAKGAPAKNAPGWYDYKGSLSCSARLVSGEGRNVRLQDGTWRRESADAVVSVACHVRRSGASWEAWLLTREPDATQDAIEPIGEAPTQVDAVKLAQSRLVALGARVSPIDADWKTHPATDRQLDALRRWGIRRDTSGMSRGEASALMDAVRCHRLVGQQIEQQPRLVGAK